MLLAARSGALALLLAVAAAAPARGDWQTTLDRVARAVVALRVSAPRAFDTDAASVTHATGFVVDAERGIILTNRHVVGPGPVVAEAVFLNHEEVPVRAVYYDPVHDFGLFRFDPADVRFMDLVALALAPERARVGTDVRVVGNDAGEKLSILAGTLARLDRDAPRYGRGQYNDFNTFYFQAASSTSGGSSGSPVVDAAGRVVALNAGGRREAASSFYLPLDRVVRALAAVRRGEPVPRGTLQAVFSHRPYDELRRLGLRAETEAAARARDPGAVGMLVVSEVVPDGPADGALQVGDVLVRAQGRALAGFEPLAEVLDGHVGRAVELEVERGGESRTLAPVVQDLHAVTPDRYLEFGGAVLHPLSYQLARSRSVPVAGVHLAAPGYVFSRADVHGGAVITAVDGETVATLEALESALAALPHGERVPIRYFRLGNPLSERVALISIDRLWFPMRLCVRDRASGSWPCTDSPPPPPPPETPAPVTTSYPTPGEDVARELAPSLAMIEFDVPFRIDGIHGDRFRGTGVVVDAERGLVVTDRETVPVALGDLTLTFAGSVSVPGELVYLHPVHNLAVVSYDPARLGETPVRSARLEPRALEAGDDVWLVGLSRRHQVVSRETHVSQVEAPLLPLPQPPRFRESNLELVLLEDSAPTQGGVLADGRGRVLAIWAAFSAQKGNDVRSFFAGIPTQRVLEIAGPLREGRPVDWRDLGAELGALNLVDARHLGVDAEIARRIERHDGRRRVLSVRRVTAGTATAETLEVGDLLLAIDGEPATDFVELERAAQAERVGLEVLRDGVAIALELATTPLDGRGTERCLLWAGTLLQEPHRPLAAQRGIEPEGVYVAWLWYGSPANRYGLNATRRIVAVDGVPVPDLDAFLAEVSGRPDRSPLRLRVVDLEGREEVVTLVLDLEFWPTSELRRGEEGWERIDH